jgi:MobI protein
MATLQPLDLSNRPSDDISSILDWMSGHFHDIADEGQAIVDTYWREMRLLENNRPFYQRTTLGLRMRVRDNLSLSLEWYLMGTLGRTKKPVARFHITKGRLRDDYPLRTLMRSQPAWMTDLVETTELQLTGLRKRHSRLLKVRDALGEFHRLKHPDLGSGSKLMIRHLLGA